MRRTEPTPRQLALARERRRLSELEQDAKYQHESAMPSSTRRAVSRAIDPAHIRVPPEQRELNEDTVATLVNSIKEIGQKTPIQVRFILENGEHVPMLVAGRHRMEACRRLGRDVQAITMHDEREAQLWRIAENLHRAELTESERREHIAAWVKLVQEKLPHGAAVSQRGLIEGRGNQGAIAKVAKDLRLSKDTVARAVAAESRPPEVKAAADHAGLGTVDRAAIAREPTEKQIAAIERRKQSKAQARRIEKQKEEERDRRRAARERRTREAEERRRFEIKEQLIPLACCIAARLAHDALRSMMEVLSDFQRRAILLTLLEEKLEASTDAELADEPPSDRTATEGAP